MVFECIFTFIKKTTCIIVKKYPLKVSLKKTKRNFLFESQLI